jgi:WD40-like Beta Propeller Repeat
MRESGLESASSTRSREPRHPRLLPSRLILLTPLRPPLPGRLIRAAPGKPELLLRTPADELVPRFSPDERWIAYQSNESRSVEICVRPFPAASGGKWQNSNGGGLYRLWSNNGSELFYETADGRIMVVHYTVDGASFVPGKPRVRSDMLLF